MTPRATIIFATVVVAVIWAAIELSIAIPKKWPRDLEIGFKSCPPQEKGKT